MGDLRSFVHKYVSEPVMITLTGATLLALILVAQSYFSVVQSSLSDIESDSTPYVHTKVASVYLAEEHLKQYVHSSPEARVVPNRSLAEGESSKEVLSLQRFLQAGGYFPSYVEPNGVFGATTLFAVKKYQEAKKLPIEGIVGPGTRAAWTSDIAKALSGL